ncbi:MAG: hypothetical protein Q8S84_02255 [bacterium]|nr:hypothetical protein [bacterium]MDP3380375.1 hypothetical protein [bacterium]
MSELSGAIKNNIFDKRNTHIASKISLCFTDKNNQPKATIKLYHTSV